MKIYAIRDNAIEAYGQPIFVRAQGQAVRSFIDECNNTESQLNKRHSVRMRISLCGKFALGESKLLYSFDFP